MNILFIFAHSMPIEGNCNIVNSWNDKVVVITGGTAGVGKSLANAMQQAGAQTVVIARNPDRLDRFQRRRGLIAFRRLVLLLGSFVSSRRNLEREMAKQAPTSV